MDIRASLLVAVLTVTHPEPATHQRLALLSAASKTRLRSLREEAAQSNVWIWRIADAK
jgi:hypothetical protein